MAREILKRKDRPEDAIEAEVGMVRSDEPLCCLLAMEHSNGNTRVCTVCGCTITIVPFGMYQHRVEAITDCGQH